MQPATQHLLLFRVLGLQSLEELDTRFEPTQRHAGGVLSTEIADSDDVLSEGRIAVGAAMPSSDPTIQEPR
jgi:hypothetical protein